MNKLLKIGSLFLCGMSVFALNACKKDDIVEIKEMDTVSSDSIITFVIPNGGEGTTANLTVKKGDSVNMSDWIPTVSGYEFKGWFLDDTHTLKFENDIYTPNGDVTFYAKLTLTADKALKEFYEKICMNISSDYVLIATADGITAPFLEYDSETKLATGAYLNSINTSGSFGASDYPEVVWSYLDCNTNTNITKYKWHNGSSEDYCENDSMTFEELSSDINSVFPVFHYSELTSFEIDDNKNYSLLFEREEDEYNITRSGDVFSIISDSFALSVDLGKDVSLKLPTDML